MMFKRNTVVIFNSYAQSVFDVVDSVYKQAQGTEGTLTGGLEGAHSDNSLHYRGLAWDFRLPIDNKNIGRVLEQLKLSLTASYYDILLEKDHIHIEYDPKMRRGL